MLPIITVNGKQLTLGQSMTIHAALQSFATDLSKDDLGKDQVGKEMTKMYLGNIQTITALYTS